MLARCASACAGALSETLQLLIRYPVAAGLDILAVCIGLQNNTQLGFFFFRKEDAEALVEKVRMTVSKLASSVFRLPSLLLLCPQATIIGHKSQINSMPVFLVDVQIREENPRLARDSKILRVTMDNVYEVFTTPREQTGLQVGLTSDNCHVKQRHLVSFMSLAVQTQYAHQHMHLGIGRCLPCSWLQGIHFRFMPDMRQVSHALQVRCSFA